MELRQIKYFLGVAEDLHFSRASERMYIAQSALSRQIQQLENEIGILLFERDKRNVKLTPAGEFLKNEWKRMINEADDILRHAKQINTGEVGKIRIGHPGSAMYSILPQALKAMQDTLPDVKVELIEINEVDILESLLNYKLDLGLSRQQTTDKDIACTPLFAENFALVVNATHRLNTENFRNLKQAKDEKFILPPFAENSVYIEALNAIFRQNGFKPRKAYESNFGSTIIKLIEQNLGVGLMPISYAKGASNHIRFIPLPDISEMFLIFRKTNENPVLKKAIKVFEEEARRM